jgi:lipopolysaccharide/colanic/teichoic acid biosynthesis glycosyltransferase
MTSFPKLVSARLYLLSFLETGLTAACYTLATYLYVPYDASLYMQYEGGAFRIALVAFSFLIASYLFDFYRQIQVRSRLVLALQLSQLIGIIFLIQAALSFISNALVLPQMVVLMGSVLTLLVLIPSRLFLRPALWKAIGAQKVLFIGVNPAVEELAEAFVARPALGLMTAGYLVAEGTTAGSGLPVLGCYESLDDVVAEIKPNRIIVGFEDLRDKSLLHKLFDLKAGGISIETAAHVYESVFGRIYSRGLDPYMVIFRNELAARPASVALQSIYTNMLALAGVIITLPLMLLIGVALKISSRGGAVLVKLPCLGLHGVPFNMYRFECSRYSGNPLSRFLARHKLNTLPQALNIIRGEMALIGPRAERMEFGQVLGSLVPFYRQNQHVKPGVLGWSQLHCDPYPVEDTLARLEYDLYYIKHISLVLDAYILLRAIKWMLSGTDELEQ